MQLLPLTAYSSAGLMPTEARGNYFPEPFYLRETKTYHSQPRWQLFRPDINTAHFYFFCSRSYVKLLHY